MTDEELKPCPFCGAGTTQIADSTHWTGMSSVVLASTVRHWCDDAEGKPGSFLQVKGKSRQQAIKKWNKRV
jgi:hypothetical protein